MKAFINIVARQVSKRTGTGRTIVEHTRHLANAGHRVVVTGESLDQKEILAAGGTCKVVGAACVPRILRRQWFASRVGKLIKSWQPDLVWGHGDHFEQDILSLHNCVHLAHQVIYPQASPIRSRVSRMHAEQLRRGSFKLLIANSNLMAVDVADRFKIAKDRIRVIYPGYDPTQFHAHDRQKSRRVERAALGLDEGTLLLALVTSGDFRKRNVFGCLKAFASACQQTDRLLHLLVVGKADNQVDKWVDNLGLRALVTAIPPRQDIQFVYQAADLCVHPALIEEFGQVVQESVVCGTPVLTSKMVGSSELFPKDVLVLDKPSHESLVRGILTFVSHDEYRLTWWDRVYPAMRTNTWQSNFQRTMGLVYPVLTPN